uniref:(northern house mosquito) hypothetical protein n=1 Tax=Culex pipiens TaxID=7175 RepID=A0A8D8AJ37_CULPI
MFYTIFFYKNQNQDLFLAKLDLKNPLLCYFITKSAITIKTVVLYFHFIFLHKTIKLSEPAYRMVLKIIFPSYPIFFIESKCNPKLQILSLAKKKIYIFLFLQSEKCLKNHDSSKIL